MFITLVLFIQLLACSNDSETLITLSELMIRKRMFVLQCHNRRRAIGIGRRPLLLFVYY